MRVNKILLTGDDGYQALGIRLLIHHLKDKYQLKVAATQGQRSAVGGGVTKGGKWGRETVDGIEAIWVDGTPADAVECAEVAFGKDFDLVISGINQGANVGSCNASGATGAALRALSRGTAPLGIALSWLIPPSFWFQESADYHLEKHLEHPGKTALQLIKLAIKEKFWGAEFLNIILPAKTTNKISFCQPIKKEMIDYYNFEIILNKKQMTFTHKLYDSHQPGDDLTLDANAVEKGFITITPWLSNLYLNKRLLKLIGKVITL